MTWSAPALRAILSGQSGVGGRRRGGGRAGRHRHAAETQPDVAILDYQLPALERRRGDPPDPRRPPRTEVLIFTMHESESLLRELLEAGARGYLLKSDAGSS